MVCIYCGQKTKTTNSRSVAKTQRTWRRRSCISCKAVFTTSEAADWEKSMRVKGGSSLEPFSRDKLFLSLHGSLSHRKTAITDAKWLTDTILAENLPCKSGVLDASEIKAAAQEALRRFDNAAFTHYKAHHK